MSNSGLLSLSDAVRAWFVKPTIAQYFAGLGVTTPFVGTTGWRQREQQLNQGQGQANRVLFIPGTLDGREEGTLEEPRRTAGNPRSLVRWNRIVTASIWSVDNAAPGNTNNEELQIAASDNLLEMTTQALVHVGHADIVFTKLSRDPAVSTNMPFGREVLLEFIHREPLFDLVLPVVTGATPTVTRNPAS